MYFRAPGRPDPRHLRLIDICTHIAAIAMSRHQRVEALRASEERVRLALSGGNVDIWEYDVATAHFRWHGGLQVIFGWPDAEIWSSSVVGRHSSRGPSKSAGVRCGTR